MAQAETTQITCDIQGPTGYQQAVDAQSILIAACDLQIAGEHERGPSLVCGPEFDVPIGGVNAERFFIPAIVGYLNDGQPIAKIGQRSLNGAERGARLCDLLDLNFGDV